MIIIVLWSFTVAACSTLFSFLHLGLYLVSQGVAVRSSSSIFFSSFAIPASAYQNDHATLWKRRASLQKEKCGSYVWGMLSILKLLEFAIGSWFKCTSTGCRVPALFLKFLRLGLG